MAPFLLVEVDRTEADLLGRVRLALADRYAVERVLGQGGTAVVFLAQDLRHSRPVAIKVLRPEIAMIVGADRFLHEIETVARLQHPHILPLYDSGEAAGLLYFVMPHVQGDSLRDRLEREKQLPVEDAVIITREVASALAFAHERGVVHRDIKPENIMLFGGAAVVADFGIARVLSVAGAASGRLRTTETGLALGTPLYMSPEQAAASGDVDARSDQYSLACVLYEMLGGMPPFTGISPSDVMAHHLHERPRPISELRSTVPPPLALAVARALSKLPADRFRSITEFSDALRAPSGEHPPVRRVPHLARWLIAAAAVVVLVLVGQQLVGDSSLDPGRYAVLPLAETSERAAPDGLKGEHVAMLLRSAMQRWSDISVVSDVLVSDAVGQTGRGGLTFREALAAARKLGAGSLVWGGQYAERDSVRLSIGLYDVRRGGRRVRELSLTVAPELTAFSARVGAVADSLLADRVTLRFGAAPIGTASRAAWNEYAAGHSALARWDVAQAAGHFDRAGALDPEFALALLWSAQVRAWRGLSEDSWERPAHSAAALAGRLTSSRDSGYVWGLVALAEHRFPDACRSYRNILDRDSTDVVALIGLGDCNIRDRAVIRSRQSPTGWAFRGSVQTAIRSYSTALELAPAFNFTFGNEAYQRLSAMFYVERNHIRSGQAVAPDSGRFASFPALQGDTLAFIPDRYRAALNGPRPATLGQAITLNREQLRRVVDRWQQDYPARPEPHATQALVLELDGILGPARHGEPTALDEIAMARQLAPDSLTALHFATTHVRLLLKSLQFDRARQVSDSVLRVWTRPAVVAANDLSGLAALVGHAGQAATYSALADSTMTFYQRLLPPGTPLEVIGTARRMSAYAGFGGPRDTLAQLADRMSALLVRYVQPQNKASVWHTLMDDPLALTFLDMPQPRAQPRDPHGNYLLEIEDVVARGDSAEALRRLRGLYQAQSAIAPGEVAVVGVLQEARLLLVLGDSATASRWLRGVLDNLQVAPTLLIDEPIQAASLVRAMALLAELSAAAGDRMAARLWASRTIALWSGCDDGWRPVIGRMQALAN